MNASTPYNGMPVSAIARFLGLGEARVYQLLRQHEIQRLPTGGYAVEAFTKLANRNRMWGRPGRSQQEKDDRILLAILKAGPRTEAWLQRVTEIKDLPGALTRAINARQIIRYVADEGGFAYEIEEANV